MLYFILFFLLFFSGFLDLSDVKFTIRQSIFWLFIVTFTFLGSIRWKTGTDWHNYINFFLDNNSFTQFTKGNFEFGYGLLSYIAKTIGNDYSIFLTLFSIFILFTKGYALNYWRYKEYCLISLLIFYCYHMGDICPGRQSLALSIILFSGQYVIDRKLIPFLLCVYLATLFHTSSFIFLAAYPLATVNVKTKTIVLILTASAVGGFILTSLNAFQWIGEVPFLPNDAQNKLDAYTAIASRGADTTGGSEFVDTKTSFITGLIRKVVVLVPLVIFRKRLSERFEYFNVLFNLIIFGAVFYFTLGTLMQVLKRGASYYDIFEVVAIPMFIFICQNKWQRVFVYCFIAAYSFAKLYMVISYYWDAYIPFNSIFDSLHRNW